MRRIPKVKDCLTPDCKEAANTKGLCLRCYQRGRYKPTGAPRGRRAEPRSGFVDPAASDTRNHIPAPTVQGFACGGTGTLSQAEADAEVRDAAEWMFLPHPKPDFLAFRAARRAQESRAAFPVDAETRND